MQNRPKFFISKATFISDYICYYEGNSENIRSFSQVSPKNNVFEFLYF